MIYLDHHASTPVAPQVIELMVQATRQLSGNPGSVHAAGRAARMAVDQARRKVAALIGCREREVVFTSGGTEANNLALRGAFAAQIGRPRVVTTAVEHPSVRNTVAALEASGAEVTVVGVSRDGSLDRAAFSAAMGTDVALVSVMLANNETGVLFPLEELAEEAHSCGAFMHIDAVQCPGRIGIDCAALGADLLSLSAHKINGPKGVGALFISRSIAIEPILSGGNQERGLRSGTENTVGIVGFGAAAEGAAAALATQPQRLSALRDYFEAAVVEAVPGVRVHGEGQLRLPSVTNLGFEAIEGEALLLTLDMAGICASSGSACASGSMEPSHVLMAMGYSAEEAHGSMRFSFGDGVEMAQCDAVVAHLKTQVPKLRALLAAMDT